MPRWRIIAAIFATLGCSVPQNSRQGGVHIAEGEVIIWQDFGHGIEVHYDGNDDLIFRHGGETRIIAARPPAFISLSPTGNYIQHNFGDGSGQVLDIEFVNFDSGAVVDSESFKNSILRMAFNQGCALNADEISLVFVDWVGENAVEIQVENWSRRPECDIINRQEVYAIP